MDEGNIPSASDALTIINGGVEIEVVFNNGATEVVKVRQLPLRLMPKYGVVQGDEGALLELFTDQSAEWVDTLTQESQEAVIKLGDRLNIDPFFRWSERRLAANERLMPLAGRASDSVKSVPPSVLAATISRTRSQT